MNTVGVSAPNKPRRNPAIQAFQGAVRIDHIQCPRIIGDDRTSSLSLRVAVNYTSSGRLVIKTWYRVYRSDDTASSTAPKVAFMTYEQLQALLRHHRVPSPSLVVPRLETDAALPRKLKKTLRKPVHSWQRAERRRAWPHLCRR